MAKTREASNDEESTNAAAFLSLPKLLSNKQKNAKKNDRQNSLIKKVTRTKVKVLVYTLGLVRSSQVSFQHREHLKSG